MTARLSHPVVGEDEWLVLARFDEEDEDYDEEDDDDLDEDLDEELDEDLDEELDEDEGLDEGDEGEYEAFEDEEMYDGDDDFGTRRRRRGDWE